MGFYVDAAELREMINSYNSAKNTVTSDLNDAKKSMKGIITSNSMYGEVGKAIAANINNHQNVTIVGLKNVYELLAMDMQKTYDSFQSTTSESSDSAVLDQDTIEKAKDKLVSFKEIHTELRAGTKEIYASIADLIHLDNPSASDYNEVHTKAKKHLKKIIDDVKSFESAKTSGDTKAKLQSILQDIQSAEGAGSLAYTDPQFLAFANETSYADGMKELNKKIEKQKKAQKKAKEEDINNMTRKEMVAKYGKNDPMVKKRLKELGNGISWSSIGSGLISSSAMLGKELLTSKISEEIAEKMASGIINTIKYNTTTFMNKSLVAITTTGTNVTFSAPPTMLTSVIRNGAKYAVPGVGALIDFGMQKRSGEDTGDALIKTGGHIGAGILGAEIGTLIGGPFGTAVGFGIGVVGSMVFDGLYDNKDKIANGLEKFVYDVGDAITGVCGSVSSAFD